MDLGSALGLLSVLFLVLMNGFFVATEFAIVAVRRSRLDQLAAEGSANAAAARDVVGHLDAYIAACQLGITMASLALGWIGEPAFAHLVEPPLEMLVGSFAPTAAHGVAVGVSFALITALHIVIGELAPKGLALQKAEATTLWITPPIRLFYALFRWPIHGLNAVGNGVLRIFGLQPATGHEMVHSVEELRLLVTGMQQAGVVEASEARIASRAFRFADLDAGALMTPRTEIEAVSVSSPREALARLAREGRHSRVLVIQQTLDEVVGVLYVRDLFREFEATNAEIDLARLVRPVIFAPESRSADELLEDMRTHGQHLAVVTDEYGGTAGLVTLQDLVEALIGRVQADETPAQGLDAGFEHGADGSLVVDGLLRLEELEEIADIRVPAELHAEVDTVGGLVMSSLGRVPDLGDEVAMSGRTLRVEQMDGRRVARVRLLPAAEPPPHSIPEPD